MKEVELNSLGDACPIPLVKAGKEIAKLDIGDLLIVSIDHSCAMKNLPEWARDNGHNVEIEETGEGQWDVFIEKAK